MSLYRISIACSSYSLLALAILPSLLFAKQSFNYPTTGLGGFGNSGAVVSRGGVEYGVTSPSFPDTQAPGFTDHSSMSPDSWSAPPTARATAPQFVAPLTPSVTQLVPSQNVAPQNAFVPANQFENSTQFDASTPASVATTGPVENPLGATPTNAPQNNTQSNSFLSNRPELLKFDAIDALSNSAATAKSADSETPNIPELHSKSPFKLAKTQVVVQVPDQLPNQVPPNQVPPNQVSTLKVVPPTGATYQDILAAQNAQLASPINSLQSQPQFLDPVVPNLSGARYPLSQSNPSGATTTPYQPAPTQVLQQPFVQQPVQQPFVQQPIQQPIQPSLQHSQFQQPSLQPFGIQPHPATSSFPKFRPDLGHRSPAPTTRHLGSFDNGEKFDFENKKEEYPPLSEILKTGRYFGSIGVRFVRPHFQNNIGVITSSASFVEAITLDHDFETSPYVRFGFESKFGPGIEFDYFEFNEQSVPIDFTSDGTTTGIIAQFPNRGLSPFGALNAGETLSARHTIDLETFGVSFFKEVQLKKPRINGRFGLQYVSIAQDLDATVTDATGEIGTFNSRSDFRGLGPKFTLEYYRPVGHTKLEFVTTAAGGVAYGRLDEFVDNSLGQGFSRAGADEIVTNVEFFTGVQFKRNFAENRSIFGRLGGTYSTWLGGGTANDPQSDFGLRGFSFELGYNR